jgi:predicted O-methyltransferase YrrM
MWNVAAEPFVLERIPLSALIPDPFVVTLGPLKSQPHNTSEYELLCLASLVKAAHVETAFEIGTFDGRSARAMAMNLSAAGHLYTLNLPPGHDRNAIGVLNVDSMLNTKVSSGFRFANTPEAERITQVFGDSATFDFTPFEARMDLVFIDGSHTTEYVKNDTEAAIRMVKPSGGWIVWHDAPLYGVAPYLTQQMKRHGWPVRLLEGTTLAVGYCAAGEFVHVPTFASPMDATV